nr:hypothetical protein [Actinomadura sp. CNU-125]
MREDDRVAVGEHDRPASGATSAATSWTLPRAGSLVPMSMNWRTPRAARKRTARPMNAWFSRAAVRASGITASSCSATSRSAA